MKVYRYRSLNAVEGVKERVEFYFHHHCTHRKCSAYTKEEPQEGRCSFYVEEEGPCVFEKGFWEEIPKSASRRQPVHPFTRHYLKEKNDDRLLTLSRKRIGLFS